MAIDQYSLCPCGSGKKIKFCKCADNIQEMSKVARMMEGEQSVAALDRINQLLKTYPSDAWLHAMKCDLLLRLKEIEPLEEASAKFVRLRPDNPLAQMYRSLLAIMRGNLQEASALFLQGVADSGDNYHPILPLVGVNLIASMAKSGMTLPAILHCEYLMDFIGDSNPTLSQVYESIVSNDSVNLLSRETIPSPPDVDDQPWVERYSEACLMLSRHRIQQAKSKLESLQREFGSVSAIMMTLLHCKLLLLDVEGSHGLCGKLAESSDLSWEQRVYYKAIQLDLDPVTSKVYCMDRVVQYEVEPEIEAKLLTNAHLLSTEQEELKQIVSRFAQEEVPPKHVFVTTKDILGDEFQEYRPRATLAWAAYFGKQTDKPARVIMVESSSGMGQGVTAELKAELQLENGKTLNELPTLYCSGLRAGLMLEKPLPEEVSSNFDTRNRARILEEFLNLRLDALGNRTIAECGGVEEFKLLLSGLVLHLQGENIKPFDSRMFADLSERLGLVQPKLDASRDLFDLVGGAAYFWTDLANIDQDSLIRLMQSALSRRVEGIFADLVATSHRTDWIEELKVPAEYTTCNIEVRVCSNPEQAEKLLERIYHAGRSLGLPVGNAVLERLEVLSHLGREGDARVFFQRAVQDNPKDPYLLQYLEMIRYEMQQREMQEGRADLSHALNRHVQAPRGAAAASGSGIWTPDSPSRDASPASTDASQGESKLWLPGQ